MANKYTKTALSFIDSSTVRNVLENAGIEFSAENAMLLVFHSNRPQSERFPVMLEILGELNTPEAQQLAEVLRQQDEITEPAGNPHYIFREKFTENPREFLTAAQMKRWLARHPNEELVVDVYSRGRVVCSELYLDRNGVYWISSPPEAEQLLTKFVPPALTVFQPGDIVRYITDGSLWVVINADFASWPPNFYQDCDYLDFSAMVVPYEYREYATQELIKKHYTEREPGTVDVISWQHEHLYLPYLELVTHAE